MHRTLVKLGVVCTGVALSLGSGAAIADSQPADLGNVANITRGASAEGPHCHFALRAGGNSPFDTIITGAAHEGHLRTNASTGGVFQATDCP